MEGSQRDLLQLYRVVPGVVGKQQDVPATELQGRFAEICGDMLR